MEEEKCTFTVEYKNNPVEQYGICGRPVKWVTPDGKKCCGIHRRMVDKDNVINGTNRKCIKL